MIRKWYGFTLCRRMFGDGEYLARAFITGDIFGIIDAGMVKSWVSL